MEAVKSVSITGTSDSVRIAKVAQYVSRMLNEVIANYAKGVRYVSIIILEAYVKIVKVVKYASTIRSYMAAGLVMVSFFASIIKTETTVRSAAAAVSASQDLSLTTQDAEHKRTES